MRLTDEQLAKIYERIPTRYLHELKNDLDNTKNTVHQAQGSARRYRHPDLQDTLNAVVIKLEECLQLLAENPKIQDFCAKYPEIHPLLQMSDRDSFLIPPKTPEIIDF